MRFSELINTTTSYRGSFSYESHDAIFIDIPRVVEDYFSVFWVGNPTFDHVVDFRTRSLQPNDWLSTTFFFPRMKTLFEAELVGKISQERERDTIDTHSEPPDHLPRFVRYEVYDRNPKDVGLPVSLVSFRARFVVWAAISTPAQIAQDVRNEAGVYLNVRTLERVLDDVTTLIKGTIKPDIPKSQIVETLNQAIELVKQRWKTPWPAALT
jgi:hypothetical protein